MIVWIPGLLAVLSLGIASYMQRSGDTFKAIVFAVMGLIAIILGSIWAG
jgi:hypothetical protein